ncbi:hypothetical protein H0H81_002779 [Sphagnurus paluster]|uniref:PH domain-containing protein n=1 Tax=Sphagnurus paluster TaxID=117069 RepID=A0A9P7FVJ7_9AGAR|nr:hypothetical protein H0H81_002779 [Sphagnurus paluster]
MRRITVSPSPSQQNSDSDAYTDDNSIDEVEATLNNLDDEFDDAENALTEWSHGSSSGPSYTASRSYTGTYTGTFTGTGYTGSPSYVSLPHIRSPPSPPPVDPRARLSKITEKTEESSRPNSGAFSTRSTLRLANPAPEAFRRSILLSGTTSAHSRSSTDPGDRTLPPPGRATELIAVFETNSPSGGHSRTTSAPGVRPTSPYYTTTSYGYGSRPSSPSKSTGSYTATDTRPTGSSYLSPAPRPSSSFDGTFRSTTPVGTYSRGVGSSYLTPSAYTSQSPSTYSRTYTGTGTDARTYTDGRTYTGTDGRSQSGTETRTYTGSDSRTYTGTDTRSYTATDTRTYTGTETGTYTDTYTGTNTNTGTTPISTLRRPQTSPRSPLTSVRNIVALWKERTPTNKSPTRRAATSVSPPPDGEGLFGIRRRAQRANTQLQRQDPVTPVRKVDTETSSMRNGHLPPGLDVADLLPYTQSNEAPLHIGLLWYLNVHDTAPFRWQRCQALLYPQLLLLSWLSPGGGRGIVALDLLNCTSVQSAPSPTHPSARDDIGTIAAKSQGSERDGQTLMDMLVPFHMLYADGVERLAAESLLERQKWVNRLWEAVNRPVILPDSSSVTRSPTGSIRTILSIDSRTSVSSTGSRSTVYVPPLRTLPSIPDFSSNVSSTSSRSRGLGRRVSLVSSHHTRTVDDTVISNQEYVYPGDPRAIQPARTGSLLRRSGSMTDLDAEFASAVTRARGAKPGLGFANLIFGSGSPVTISSGPNMGRNVTITPPPSSGRGSDRARSEVSDEQFFSAGSSEARSSYYSQGSGGSGFSSELRTSTGPRTDGTSFLGSTTGTGTHLTPSSAMYTRDSSDSYVGDSQDSLTYTGTSPSTLSRTREVRRRRQGGSSSRSQSTYTDGSSEKEQSNGSYTNGSYTNGTYTPDSGTQTFDSRSYGSGSFTPSSGSYTYDSRSYTTNSGSYTPGSYSSGSYTPGGGYSTESSGIYSGAGTFTPDDSNETGYDICHSSDFTTTQLITSSDDNLTPLSSTLPSEDAVSERAVSVHAVSDVASELESEHFLTASQASTEYLSARSPSLKGSIRSYQGSESSYASFPSIPSEVGYKTADTGYSHYRSLYEPTPGTEYVTAEICPTIPSEQNTPTRSVRKLSPPLSVVKLESETGAKSVLGLPSAPPSEMPSIRSPIRSPSMFSEVFPALPASVPTVTASELAPSPSPPLPPLPPSVSTMASIQLTPSPSPPLPALPPSAASAVSIALTPSPSPPLPPLPTSMPSLSPQPSLLTPTEESPDVVTPTSFRSPSHLSTPRALSSSGLSSSIPALSSTISSSSNVTPSSLVLSSSPVPSEYPTTLAPRLSSSPSISSVSSLSDLTPPFTATPPPPPSPQRWAEESDVSYDSSHLAPSPSVMSLAVNEGADTSFETSFLRPSRSGVSSVDRLSAIPETPTTMSSMPPRSLLPQLTPVPMGSLSISSSSDALTPSSLSLSAAPARRSPLSLASISPAPVTRSPLPTLTAVPTMSSSMASSSDIDTPSSMDVTTPRTFSLSESSLSTLGPYEALPLSLESSADVRTPSDISLSEGPGTPLARAASNASTLSFRSQSSLNSSVFDSRSLLEDEDEEEEIGNASTIPSLLTTPSQHAREMLSPFSLHESSLPTPQGSIVVTLSTPQGSAQTSQSSLRTQTSESVPTERDLSRDIDRLVDDLRRYDDARGNENRELADNVRALRDELQDLSDYLHRTPPPPPQVIHQHIVQAAPQEAQQAPAAAAVTIPQRTPVALVDRMVGSSPMPLSVPPLPMGPREMSVRSVQLSRATSSASSIGSYLSSHHSDDDYLMEGSYMDSPLPWLAPTISESDNSESSSMFSETETSVSPPYPDSSESSVQPPPASPTPSSTPSSSSSSSVSTARQAPVTPPDLFGPLGEIRAQIEALAEGQRSTNDVLNILQGRPSFEVHDDTELKDRLDRIEDLVQRLINQPRNEPQIVYEQYPAPPLSSLGSDISLGNLQDRLRSFETESIRAPVPTREGPSLVERLEEILAAGVNLPPPEIQPPPSLVNLHFSRRQRRTLSPVSIHTIPVRPESEPPLPQAHTRPVRNVPRRRAPRAPLPRDVPAAVDEEATPQQMSAPLPEPQQQPEPPQPQYVPPPQPQEPPAIPQAEPDIDFEREVRARRERVPNRGPPPAPPVSNLHGPPRSQTAPPPGEELGQSWYRTPVPSGGMLNIPGTARPSGAPAPAPGVPAPTTAAPMPTQNVGQQSQSSNRIPYMPMPPGPVIVQLPPVFDNMMGLLRENRDAQNASVEQQRELMRYMRALNDWLARDTNDRQNELQGLNARVDRLRQDILDIQIHGERA